MINFKKNLIFLIIGVVGILVAGAIIYTISGSQKDILSHNEAAEKSLGFINENLLQEGMTASLIEIIEESGLYKMKLKINEEEFDTYITKDGKVLFPQFIVLEEAEEEQIEQQAQKQTIGNFSVSEDEICEEDDKPIVYFFGSEGCPACGWEHPVIEKVMAKFEGKAAFHNNMDSNEDMDVFSKYSTGSIPTLVLGCKYYRIGSGQRAGEEEESNILTAIICKLTQNQPAEICDGVQELIDQIE
jgi:thiol-disulfide isomerase/thioredoxin